MPEDNYLRTLLELDSSSSEFPDQLYGVINGSDFDDYVTSLGTNDLLEIIEYLDKVRYPH